MSPAGRERNLVAIATSFENSKIASAGIAEPNGENRVKIRPVEVEIIGLTEIVKKEKKDTEATPLAATQAPGGPKKYAVTLRT